MNSLTIGAVILTALSIHAMHVSSDEETLRPKNNKSIEMKNFAEKSPLDPKPAQSDAEKNTAAILPVVNQFFTINNNQSTTIPPHPYTLASIDKKP